MPNATPSRKRNSGEAASGQAKRKRNSGVAAADQAKKSKSNPIPEGNKALLQAYNRKKQAEIDALNLKKNGLLAQATNLLELVSNNYDSVRIITAPTV